MKFLEERKRLTQRDKSFKKENCKTSKLEEGCNRKLMKSNQEKMKLRLITKKKSLILQLS